MFEHIEEKEAVKTAALIEINGYMFYKLLADRTHSSEVKAVFRKLADDEKKHLKLIETVFFPEAGFTEQITQEEIEIEDYLEREGRGADLFTRKINIDELVASIDTHEKALKVALDTERHSVHFFQHFSNRASTEEGRRIYRELAEEEMSHVSQLEAMLAG
jgi:rubrerythrin